MEHSRRIIDLAAAAQYVHRMHEESSLCIICETRCIVNVQRVNSLTYNKNDGSACAVAYTAYAVAHRE